MRFRRNQSEPPSTAMPSGILRSPRRHMCVSHSKKSRSRPCLRMNLERTHPHTHADEHPHTHTNVDEHTHTDEHVSHRVLSLPWDLMKFMSRYFVRKPTSCSLVLGRADNCQSVTRPINTGQNSKSTSWTLTRHCRYEKVYLGPCSRLESEYLSILSKQNAFWGFSNADTMLFGLLFEQSLRLYLAINAK